MKINRLVHPGFWFGKTSEKDALELARMGAGGFCIYGGTRETVADLIRKLRAASPHKKILISADYEDGLGRWLPDAELLPSNLALGAANRESLAFEKGFLTARQAKSLGVDWVFAPVVDLADNPNNPIVNTRSFGADPALVTHLAGAFMDGLKKGGALNSLKHFPGHGNTDTDSHLALPVVSADKTHLQSHELAPFRALLTKTDCVMIGHLLVPSLDDKNPASTSDNIIRGLLQEEMGFTGCISTDALLMKALGDEKQAALKAFLAGTHVLLAPENPFELMAFLRTQNLPQDLVLRANQIQNRLCAQADEIAAPTEAEAFVPTGFSARTARAAITQTGAPFTLKPGETVHFLEIGNDGPSLAGPFLETLAEHGIHVTPNDGAADKILLLCFRQYQAFRGSIHLNETDVKRAQNAAQSAKESVFISFSSPWAINAVPGVKSAFFAFSPSAAFQRETAQALCGAFTPVGKLPVRLD